MPGCGASSTARAAREPAALGPGALRLLAEVLGVRPATRVTIEVLEGQRPVRELPVVGLVDDVLGLSAYTDIDSLHACCERAMCCLAPRC